MKTFDAQTQAAIQAGQVWGIKLVSMEVGNTTYYLTDHYKDIAFSGQTYLANGNLLSISNIKHDSDVVSQTLSIGLSAIDSVFRRDVIQADAIGGKVTVLQGFLNTSTGALLDTPFTIFEGVTWSISSSEDNAVDPIIDVISTSTFTLTAEVRSIDYILGQSVGRSTEPNSFNEGIRRENSSATEDTSMEFIADLDGRNLHFGGS